MSPKASRTASGAMLKSSKTASIARKKIRISFKKLLKRFGRLGLSAAYRRIESAVSIPMPLSERSSSLRCSASFLKKSSRLP